MSIEPPEFVVPGEFADATGIVRLTPRGSDVGEAEADIVRSILGPGTVVAMTRPPSLDDHIHVYATHQELESFMFEPELASYIRARETTVDDVIERIREIPFEPAMTLVASIQKALAFGRVDQAWQRRLMYDVYRDSAISRAGEAFLRSNERAAIFSEQQLFALQRLLVLHASDEQANDLTPDQNASLRLALFFVPGTVLATHDDLDTAPESLADERWLRYFVSNGGFAAHGWLLHDMARAHELYEVAAKSRIAYADVDFCPLHAWLQSEFGMSFVELQAFGFVVLAGSGTQTQDGPPLSVKADYFRNSAFADRTEDGFRAFAAERDWFANEFRRSPENPRRAAFEISPFLRRPGLRRSDGSVLVVAPRAIESWLGPTGTYYRLFDIARGADKETWKKFMRFNGRLQEHYARHLVYVAHPDQRRRGLIAVGRVFPDLPYRKGTNTLMTSDVAIDLGTDLVLIEITAKRLTEKTLVEADAESVRNDIQMMIEKKMQQLGRVIGDVFDDPSRLSDVSLNLVERVWPIVVSGEGIFHNPTLWAYTHERAGHYLQFQRERVPAEVKPVALLDLEELEILMGIVGAGHSLTGLLERKTSPMWLERDLKALVSAEYQPRGIGKSAFISQANHRAFRAIKRALDIRPEDAGEPAQAAA